MIALFFIVISVCLLLYKDKQVNQISEQLKCTICTSKKQQMYLIYTHLGVTLAYLIYPYVKTYRQSSRVMLKQIKGQFSKQYDFYIVSQQCFIGFLSVFLAITVSKWSSSFFIIFLGCVMCFACQHSIKKQYLQYTQQMAMNLPTILVEFILLLNAGQTLQQTWEKVAFSKKGPLYDDMQLIVLHCQNGSNFVEQLVVFSKQTKHSDIKKFMTICLQITQKGSQQTIPLLNSMLADAWEHQKNMLLKKAQATNQNLLLPGALIFMGIIIMIIGPVFINGFL